MATTLANLSAAAAATVTGPSPSESAAAHMVINLLAAPQTHAVILFSRPDLHPRLFEHPNIQWSLSCDSLPMLHGCLGALSYRVVGAPWALNDLAALGDKLTHKVDEMRDSVEVGEIGSVLFIAEVMRVEDVPRAEGTVDDNITLEYYPLCIIAEVIHPLQTSSL
jgi:Flavin reductase like domain